ncbi:mechanosensitive ion channel family protein [Aetokthonos hydrillicola Thurmond2011]|uniref:Mechanosensitive ion channel family protein n=1 Tax=Aetokthonos hydrillicola Thurmond2011 TaxID=2712845 RepID=A0AAP5IBV4_9CYAN|nr:mechanosensitive ion channel family protein [Aetokthonos hydrillicola]MBO3461967.1 mechanosensitive ion channel [Aetokthonos hydrillicola CCALA 1050]MBW4589147.1 mechanosensitive ion channel family protein [Aetokthonos hydrillicola CCALA 1050]MDR9898705.1 mechanosensitive ion channel family protein [Aetokthonos hydrillicola Thurmond2011]
MRSQFLAIAGSIVVSILTVPKADAQVPFLPDLQLFTNPALETDSKAIISSSVYLDGRSVFKIAGSRASLTERLELIQQKLDQISQDYLQSTSKNINVQVRTANGLPVIYVNDQFLMTVNSDDAKLRQTDSPQEAATQIAQQLQEQLKRAKRERQTSSLIYHAQLSGAIGISMIVASWLLSRLQRRTALSHSEKSVNDIAVDAPVTTQLKRQENSNLREAKRRLFQLAQVVIWGGGTVFLLGLFPYTRTLQLGFFLVLQIPLRLSVVALGTYIAVRFSYVLIDRFTAALVVSGALLTPESSQRLQLRVSTISVVTKGIVTIIWIGVGIFLALAALGIDVIPLLAGAGLVGVAVSLASQNLIKDAINGFLIILEDQYALGDAITVGTVEGLVEKLNLRMTQVRDAQGRLITIPNSEIKIVANLSSRWSRVDLNIPIAYKTDINEALKCIETVGLEMAQDPQWQDQILEKPQVLGVDNFEDRGVIVRVWIKTQPLKQWAIAREYRRRLKTAFDQAGILIHLT